MNAISPMKAPHSAPAEGRVSAKLRRAIDAIAIHGCTGREAARRAGIHEVTLYKALAKPHVSAALEQRKAEVILECDKLRGIAKAIAIQTGIELMQNSPQHSVRARMVEFFAGEPKGPAVAVQVNMPAAQGYVYRKADQPSVPDDAQVIDSTAQSPKPE